MDSTCLDEAYLPDNLSCSLSILYGQTHGTQVWADYTLAYPFSRVYSVYNMRYNGAYKTAFGTEKWKAIDNTFVVERSLGLNTDVSVSGLVSYEKQTEDYHTLEIRPVLGLRYHFNTDVQNHLRIYVRYEWRHLKNLEEMDWTNSNRLRIRPELYIPISRSSLQDDKLWYGLIDVEWFANLDHDQEERFANRFRTRFGIGYRPSDSFRFEFIYVLQQARDTIDEEFKGSDNILQFRVKQFIGKDKPRLRRH